MVTYETNFTELHGQLKTGEKAYALEMPFGNKDPIRLVSKILPCKKGKVGEEGHAQIAMKNRVIYIKTLHDLTHENIQKLNV